MLIADKLGLVMKFLGLFLLFLITAFIIAHFAMQYGIQAGDIQQFLANTWFMWLIVRIAIYLSCGYFLYQLQKQARNEADSLAYKRLTTAFIIGLIIIESVILVQLFGG